MRMSAFGTKRTYQSKRSFVRFWGEADMARPPVAYRSVADDPQRSLTRSGFAAVEKCLAFVPANACQSNAFPGSLS